MSQSEATPTIVAEPVAAPGARPVSDELDRIAASVRTLCPKDTEISFEYDGRLHMHLDIRGLEEVARLETLLPGLEDGIFSNLQRGLVDNRPFFHRLTVLVAR
jgi:hypothetical protein